MAESIESSTLTECDLVIITTDVYQSTGHMQRYHRKVGTFAGSIYAAPTRRQFKYSTVMDAHHLVLVSVPHGEFVIGLVHRNPMMGTLIHVAIDLLTNTV